MDSSVFCHTGPTRLLINNDRTSRSRQYSQPAVCCYARVTRASLRTDWIATLFEAPWTQINQREPPMNDKTYTTYSVQDKNGEYHDIEQSTLIRAAQECVRKTFSKGQHLTSARASADYLQVLLGGYEHEMFTVVWLDNQHKVICHSELFRGTIDSAAVYPREVVKDGLAANAAAVILAHNHPSGVSTPSEADKQITRRLKDALALVDIRLLDHLIVGETVTSLAELGLI